MQKLIARAHKWKQKKKLVRWPSQSQSQIKRACDAGTKAFKLGQWSIGCIRDGREHGDTQHGSSQFFDVLPIWKKNK